MTDVPVASPMGIRDLLRIPDFRRVFVAQGISDIGDGVTHLALFLLVLDLTGSTAAIALMSILVALPPVTIGLFAGAWADRLDRRRIMVVSDTARALVVATMVLVASRDGLPLLLALACLQAVIGTFFSPARTAMIPRVVPDRGLLAANSLGQMTRMIGGVVGAGVTGVVAGAAGVLWPVLLVDAATFLASALLVMGVSRRPGRPDAAAVETARARGVRGSVLDGLRLIARSCPLVAALGDVSMTMLGVGAINVLFIPFLVDELGASPAWAGPLEAAQTLSMVLAGSLVAVLAARVLVSTLFVAGIAGVGGCVVLLSLVPGPRALLLVLFAVGWFIMPVQAATMTIVQRSTTDGNRGRVAGALNAAIQTTTIVSMAAAGILADVIGKRAVFVTGGGRSCSRRGGCLGAVPRGSGRRHAIGVACAAAGASVLDVGLGGMGDAQALGALPELFGRAAVAVAMNTALGFAIATLARSQLAGIGVGNGVYFAEGIASIFLPAVIKWFPFAAASGGGVRRR